MKFFVNVLIDDVLMPLAMGLILNILEFRGIMEAAVYFSICEILTKLWIERCDFILLKPARKVSAPFIVPLPAMVLLSPLFPQLDIREFAYIGANYVMYIIYGGIMLVGRPALTLFFFGPRLDAISHED